MSENAPHADSIAPTSPRWVYVRASGGCVRVVLRGRRAHVHSCDVLSVVDLGHDAALAQRRLRWDET